MPFPLPPLLAAWLRRAQHHPIQSRLLLSGSALIAVLCEQARRPHDIDYVVTGVYDAPLLMQSVARIAAIAEPGTNLRVQHIAEIYEYTIAFPGIRAELIGDEHMQESRSFLVDFAFGDPLTVPPRTIHVPAIGDVLAVAPETLFAWKVHALVQFGSYGWRPKDVFDLHVLWNDGAMEIARLPEAIDVAFSSRGSDLEELDAFRSDDDWGIAYGGEKQWHRFEQANDLHVDFRTIRAEIRAILDDLL